jgi:hypothetical protein
MKTITKNSPKHTSPVKRLYLSAIFEMNALLAAVTDHSCAAAYVAGHHQGGIYVVLSTFY